MDDSETNNNSGDAEMSYKQRENRKDTQSIQKRG